MITTTFQIATFGTSRKANILTGLRRFPAQKLTLICYDRDKTKAKLFSKRIEVIDRNIEITIILADRENIIESLFGNIGKAVGCELNRFQRILVNVSSGDKLLSYVVLCAAYVRGLEIFIVNSKNISSTDSIPTPKFPYYKIITKTNLRILNSIARAGGVVRGLDELQQISGLIKPLLSYHLHGRNNTKGLIDLGLVRVEGKKHNSVIIVKLTAIGKLFATNHIS